jgi:hypothetical protein
MSGPKPNYKPLQNQAAMYSATGQDFLSRYNSGTLMPGQEAEYQLAKGEGETATRSAYAKMGLSGSTMEAQDIGYDDTRALAFKQSLLDPYLKASLDFMAGASGDLQSVLNAQTQFDMSQSGMLSGMFQAVGSLFGGTNFGSLFGGGGGAAGGAGGLTGFAESAALF